VSRAYNARRKAKRRQSRTERDAVTGARFSKPRGLAALVPAVAIVAILALVGILGFSSSNNASSEQVDQEVTELLDGIPQEGSTLGSTRAPVTLTVYGDLECPTVKLFVENYLPSIIEDWVHTGAVKLDYRSLETDTSDEEVFFEQEIATLAAGRQDRLWNFVLTAVREQGEPRTDYVTERFLTDIASQVPNLNLAQWRRDRNDALLSKQVALSLHAAHNRGFGYTPSFLIGFTEGKVDRLAGKVSIKKEFEASMGTAFASLRKESDEDFPSLQTADPNAIGG
jgi:protein-disulfide isomerase